MEEGERSTAELRALAVKCRFLADQIIDQASAASLRNMAEEYDRVADKQNGLVKPIPVAVPPRPESNSND